jgi:hypothetical protein
MYVCMCAHHSVAISPMQRSLVRHLCIYVCMYVCPPQCGDIVPQHCRGKPWQDMHTYIHAHVHRLQQLPAATAAADGAIVPGFGAPGSPGSQSVCLLPKHDGDRHAREPAAKHEHVPEPVQRPATDHRPPLQRAHHRQHRLPIHVLPHGWPPGREPCVPFGQHLPCVPLALHAEEDVIMCPVPCVHVSEEDIIMCPVHESYYVSEYVLVSFVFVCVFRCPCTVVCSAHCAHGSLCVCVRHLYYVLDVYVCVWHTHTPVYACMYVCMCALKWRAICPGDVHTRNTHMHACMYICMYVG